MGVDVHLATIWEEIADAIPDEVALIHGTRTRTRRQLDERASRLAAALAAHGIGDGSEGRPRSLQLLLAAERGVPSTRAPVTDEGRLDLEAFRSLLERGPRVVGVAHVSNVLGTINPIAEIASLAHDAGAVVVVDGAQAGPKLPLDMAELGVDFDALTAHKMYGPTGIGALYGRRELLEAMPPFIGFADR